MCLEAIQLSSLVEAYFAFEVQVGGVQATRVSRFCKTSALCFMTGDMVVKCFGLVERGVSPMRHICRRPLHCIALP